MPSKNKLNSDIEIATIQFTGVVLGYAFEALGRRLYPEQWGGNEMNVISKSLPEDPASLAAKKVLLDAEYEKADAELADLQIKLRQEPHPRKRKPLKELIDIVAQERVEIDEQRKPLANVKALKSTYDYYRRAHDVRDRVMEALCLGELEAYDVYGSLIERNVWSDLGMGGLDLEHSFLRRKLGANGSRRSLVLLDRRKTDIWLLQFKKILNDYEWASLEILTWDGPMPTKSSLLKHFKKMRPKISSYLRDDVWDEFAPEHWRKGGRRKASSKQKKA